MQSPFAFKPEQPIITIGGVFGTPLAIQGWSWLPVNQLLAWGFFTLRSQKKHTSWTRWEHTILGGLQMTVFLGSEWCHNLAHIAVARAVGKPVNAARVILGMPVLIYDEPEHPSITPHQHLLRSFAGPICNWVLLIISKITQHFIPTDSVTRDIVDTAVGMNTFIATGSLLPVPVFDGGPILKWSLIESGISPVKAAEITQQTQKVIGAGLLGSAVIALFKRRGLLAVTLSFLGLLSLATGYGRLKY